MRNTKIKVVLLKNGKTREFESVEECSKSTGIPTYMLYRVKRTLFTSVCKGKKDKEGNDMMFYVNVEHEFASSLVPAFETDLPTQNFLSHYKAIKFLGCSKNTYYNRMKLQPIGEPCDKTIKDKLGREWLVVFHQDKSEFVANKGD
jgi:hypothetical protein